MKPHASTSQFELMSRCGEAYHRRYIEGDKRPPGIAAAKGSGLHVGAETNMSQKIKTARDLTPSQIVDAAVAGFEEKAAEGVHYAPDEKGREKIVVGEAVDAVVEMAEVHAMEQAPEYQPEMVEKDFRIELPGPRDLIGFIDLIDVERNVADWKTASRSKPQADADDSLQLTVYAAAFQSITGEPAKSVRLDTIVKTKTKTTRQVLESERTPGDFEALAARINRFNSVLESGAFMPASPGDWICSPRWCGYWNSCPFINSERKEKAKA